MNKISETYSIQLINIGWYLMALSTAERYYITGMKLSDSEGIKLLTNDSDNERIK
jgi:hypothetical protein